MPLVLTLLALILLSVSVVYWVMQLYQPAQRPLAAAAPASMPQPGIDAAATLFGGQASAAVAANYQLTGVVAAGRESVAIIVADGAPPKALKLGKEVVAGVTVREVHPRYVMLSDGGVLKRIELATDTRASNGVPPSPLPGQQQQSQPQQAQQQQQQQQQPQQQPPPPPQQQQQQQQQQQLQMGPVLPQQQQAQPAPAPVQMAPPTRAVNPNGAPSQLQ
ncbi:type II secretion system protein N [Massilia sp. TWR1-2-2]|uniref:type II secretion system protein N n=1 Tax=Massilia sp. TWR1-2-2 TaxID=2804584 RepID=UPI003CECC5E3